MFLKDYGKDQGQHGEDEVFRVRSYHDVYEAEQEESEGKAFVEPVLQVLPEAYAAQREQVA